MKIMLSHPTAWPDVTRGAERYVHELSSFLAAVGHDVTVLTSSSHPGTRHEFGVEVVAFAQGRPAAFGLRCAAWSLRHQPDVWHANALYDAAAAACLPGPRSVMTAHGPAAPAALSVGTRGRAFALARRADAVVAVSPAAADQLRRDWGQVSTVVPPGVDAAFWTPGGARANRPTVLYVGTLASRRKNLHLLLEGVAMTPDVELWVAGQGTLPALPPELHGRVRHMGVLGGADLLAAYRSAWVTALISEREVFGMTVVESLACGTPALVLDDGWGPASIVTEATGVRVAALPEAVADGIRVALELTCHKGTEQACVDVAAGYDWASQVVPRMLKVYARG